ncbi:SEC-C metal-binding domain-containing protein [Paenibacillus sp. TAB 01]|uniref:SEC-C metal-binding domain-containing protein n=1 Tax=Paenibacillus sp. TAB 01 TaxID=3368988 RepID=UPI00374FE728
MKGYTLNQLSAQRKLLQSEGSRIGTVKIASKKKVGRNDPCTCGSGKKYKKCCGA